jgi:hypothetical protein
MKNILPYHRYISHTVNDDLDTADKYQRKTFNFNHLVEKPARIKNLSWFSSCLTRELKILII